MRRSARVCLLGFGLSLVLPSLACKQELDDKPAADPLEDPWVNAIEDEQPLAAAPAVAAAPVPATATTPTPSEVPSGALLAQPTPLADPGSTVTSDPATSPGVARTASHASTSTSKPAEGLPSEVAPAPEPTPAGEPAAIEPAPAPTPSAAPAAAPQPEPVAPTLTIADFNGDFRYSGGSAQRGDLDQAIEDAVMQLAMPIRGIGRKRLTNTNPIDNSLEIKVSGDKVQTIFESGFDAECTIDGGTVKWTSKKGDKYKVRVRQKGTKLVQVIEGEDGVKTTVFVLSADKQSLTVHHKIEADRLETPMTYKLSYKRN
jgi:hypothetical protein